MMMTIMMRMVALLTWQIKKNKFVSQKNCFATIFNSKWTISRKQCYMMTSLVVCKVDLDIMYCQNFPVRLDTKSTTHTVHRFLLSSLKSLPYMYNFREIWYQLRLEVYLLYSLIWTKKSNMPSDCFLVSFCRKHSLQFFLMRANSIFNKCLWTPQ